MSHADAADRPQIDPRTPPCRHLRNKGMFIYTDDSSRAMHEGHDSNHCWCIHTMKAFGPDDELVAGDDCRNPERGCYEAF
jgi:hypothetical protein